MRIWIAVTTLTLAFAALGFTSLRPSPLQIEADRVFAYDRAHPQVIPAHLVRTLSLAIAFHDDDGARKIIEALPKL